MHSVQYRRDDRVPQTGFAFKVQNANHRVTFGVVARLREGTALVQHGCSADADAHHGTVPVCGVFDVGRCVVADVRRRAPILRRLGQMFGDEPVEFWPPFERYHVAGSSLGQPFQARVGRQRHLYAATAQQESDLLGPGVTAS